MQREIHSLAEAWVGSPWSLTVAPPPAALASTVAYAPQLLTDTMIGNVEKDALKGDKVVLVSLQTTPREIHIRVRELDCHTRTWSRMAERVVRQQTAIGPTILDAIVAVFAPLVLRNIAAVPRMSVEPVCSTIRMRVRKSILRRDRSAH